MPKQKSADTGDINLLPGLASPARRALAAAGITRLEQLADHSEADLLQLHGMGPKAIKAIKEAMSQRGLKFAAEGASRHSIVRANHRIPRRASKNKR